MSNITSRIKPDPLFFVIIPLMFILGYVLEYAIIFAMILIHELGHILTGVILGQRILNIRLLPVGLNAVMDGQVFSRGKNICIYLAGPIVNISLFISGLAFCSLFSIQTETAEFFILVNLYLAIFNLMPVLPLDGGKALREAVSVVTGMIRADILMRKISVLFSILIIILGVFQIIVNYKNFSLAAAGIYILFTIKSDRTEAALMNMRSFIYRHRRLIKKGIYPARDLVALKTMCLGEIIRSMDYDRFHFVRVLDGELNYICTFSEQDIVNEMVTHGTDMTFEELIEKKRKKQN